MKLLGYTRYGAQGGDWGVVITDQIGIQAHSELIGFCINIAGAIPSNVSKVIQTGVLCHLIIQPTKDTLFERLKFFFTKFVASTLEIGNPPTDTIWNCRFISWPSRPDSRPRLA